MKPTKIKSNNTMKRSFSIAVSAFLIMLGIIITCNNLIKFVKGNLVYTTPVQSFDSDKSIASDRMDLSQLNSSKPETAESSIESEPVVYSQRPQTGDVIGELTIPKLEVSLPIYEGTSEEELESGVGHYSDSVLPGENDNSVLSGHRDTVFRNLKDVEIGDSLIVSTEAGDFEYIVNKVRIVDKDDRTVIVPKPRATLTLSTCYPFEYIGSAPERYVLVAYLAAD